MNAQTRRLVVVYSVSRSEWYIAEVNEGEVVQFGPFDSRAVVAELLSCLYPRHRSLELPEQAVKLEDEAVAVLGHAVARNSLTTATDVDT
ncbi:hypothetical protein K2O51_07955 [Cupriavidus pinatubonensis]|uniref:hypothetical protein n=1 Tax=Cupriavidus pinatubonensis TaxID=248026 RepID=UPI001C739E6F|nr:hypothetical protein [Cupriavidus pinatubonensis]QYY27852.1 hypothetical protein K2O51_07955 [Cupriavidus pinatubonensis]